MWWSAIKPQHLAALGLLLTSLAAQLATLTDWAQATRPVFIAAMLAAIGSTLVALFSDKPRDPDARERRYDPVPPKAPGWLLPFLLVGAVGTSSCALNANQGQRLQQVDLAVYSAISAVDDIEMTLYRSKVLTEQTHRQLNPVMRTTLQAGRAANEALIAWPRGDTKPPLPAFTAALDALNQLAKAVVDFTPEGPAREALKSKIDLAVQLVRGILIGIGGVA